MRHGRGAFMVIGGLRKGRAVARIARLGAHYAWESTTAPIYGAVVAGVRTVENGLFFGVDRNSRPTGPLAPGHGLGSAVHDESGSKRVIACATAAVFGPRYFW